MAEEMKGPGDSLGKEPSAPAPGQVLSKGENIVKCAKCGFDNHVLVKAEEKQDPAQGPHEDGKKSADILDTPEFKKLFDGFRTEVDTRYSELEKSYKAKEAEYDTMLKAANARIDELHKAIDNKSKALESGEQAIQKETASETKKDVGTFKMFPDNRRY